MSPASSYRELQCASCGSRSICGPSELLRRLQDVGMLRREKEPDIDMMLELLPSAAEQMRCAECDHVGMQVNPTDGLDDGDWGEARCCEQCGAAISPERLKVFPDTQRCPNCQRADEQGELSGEREFCEKCGALMVLRRSGGAGITRYVSVCSECGRK